MPDKFTPTAHSFWPGGHQYSHEFDRLQDQFSSEETLKLPVGSAQGFEIDISLFSS